jgi:hypothetical protein
VETVAWNEKKLGERFTAEHSKVADRKRTAGLKKSAAKGLRRSALPLCGINAHVERPSVR